MLNMSFTSVTKVSLKAEPKSGSRVNASSNVCIREFVFLD